MVIGVSRPPAYMRFLTRFGIFKSARPNDMVVAGLGRTFQNIRLFQNMTASDNVLVGMHSRLKATWIDALLSTPRDRREEEASREKASELLEARRPEGPRRRASPRTCRTATSAASRSPARSRPSRSSCCSTSRPPA